MEMRRATLGALRMDLEELSTDISVNGIVDHLVVDLSRKVRRRGPVCGSAGLSKIVIFKRRTSPSENRVH